MARSKTRAQRVRDQALAWQREARETRLGIERERLAADTDRREAEHGLAVASMRVAMDDGRVQQSVERLREARQRNHFTDTMRQLLGRA